MLEEQLILSLFEFDNRHKTVSIAMDTIILRNGGEISKSRHRCAFVPGQIEAVKEYIGQESSPEITYLETIWTQEVINEYILLQEGA